VPLGLGERLVPWQHRTERLGAPPLVQEPPGGGDDVERVGLARLGGGAPGGDAVAAQYHPDRPGAVPGDGGDVQAELEPGPPPRHPGHPVPEALGGQPLPVGRAGQGDAGVGVQVVDVGGVDQPVHGRVDRGGGPAPAVQAVVERGHHLVLALHPRVDVLEGPQPVQPQHGQPGVGEGAQVAA
jgi:hypothetical protein